jgi:hypothetical protein
MNDPQPSRGPVARLLFKLFGPVARPMEEMQQRLARIEKRIEPLEQWCANMNQWAHEERERTKRLLQLAEELSKVRGELNANAHLVNESSVYVERMARKILADEKPAAPERRGP